MTDPSKSSVPGFRYDVFLSYAWVDNDPDGIARAWVSEFRTKLGKALNARLGRRGQSKFFFDIETLGKNVDLGHKSRTRCRNPQP